MVLLRSRRRGCVETITRKVKEYGFPTKYIISDKLLQAVFSYDRYMFQLRWLATQTDKTKIALDTILYIVID